MKKRVRVIKTDEEFKIVADPYRMKILNVFFNHEESMTVKQIADFLKEVPANIHYHVKKLLSINIIELDYIKEMNGINAKFYRTTADTIEFDVRDDLQGIGRSLQVDRMTKVLFDVIDNYKNDLLSRANKVKILDKREIVDDGFQDTSNLYLTHQEFEELRSYINSFIQSHRRKKSGALKYSALFGIIKKEDSPD